MGGSVALLLSACQSSPLAATSAPTAAPATQPTSPPPTTAASPSTSSPAPTTASAAPTTAAVPTTSAAPTTAPAAQASPSGQKATLQVWWEDSEPKDAWSQTLAKYSSVAPNVTLESVPVPFGDIQTKVLTGLAGGLQLDILYNHPVLNSIFAQKGALVPLDSYLKGSTLDVNDFFEQGLVQLRWKNQLYSLPYDHECNLYFYRTDPIKSAGLADPGDLYKQGQWTLDKFSEYMGALSKGTGANRVFGTAEVPTTLRVQDVWIWGEGGDVFTTDYSRTLINQPPAIKGWGFLTDHILKGWAPTQADYNTFPDQVTGMFNSAKLVFQNNIRGYVFTFKPGLTVGMVPNPVMPDGKEYARIGNDAEGIYSKTPDRDVAWKALEWLIPNLNQALIAANAASPVFKSLYKSDVWLKTMLPWENADFYAKIASNARGLLLPPGFSEMDKRVQTAYQKITLKQATAQQAMDDAANQIDQLLQEAMQ